MAPRTSTPAESSPVSSSASRRAASIGDSPASMPPPGNATWPGWSSRVCARSSSRTSRSAGASCFPEAAGTLSSAPKSISTAALRATLSSTVSSPSGLRRRAVPGFDGGTRSIEILACGHGLRFCDSIRISAARCVSASSCASRASCPGASSYFRSFRALAGSVSPSAVAGAPVGHRAGAAGRLARMADPAPVEHHPVRQHGPVPRLEQLGDVEFDLRTGSSDSVQPKRRASRPKCVSTVIPGMPKALPSTTLAVFRPTPGSVTRSSSRPRHLAVVLVHEPVAQGQQVPGLGAEEAGGLDDGFQLGRIGLGHAPGIRVAGEQQRRDLVDQHIGGLRGEHRGHHQLERAAEIQLGVRVRVLLRQRPVDPAGAALQRQQGLRRSPRAAA